MFSNVNKNDAIDHVYANLSQAILTKSRWGHRLVYLPKTNSKEEGGKSKVAGEFCKLDDLIKKLKNEIKYPTQSTSKSNLLDKALKLSQLNSSKGSFFSKMKQKDLEKIIANLTEKVKTERKAVLENASLVVLEPEQYLVEQYKDLVFLVTAKGTYEIDFGRGAGSGVNLKELNDQGEIIHEEKFSNLSAALSSKNLTKKLIKSLSDSASSLRRENAL